MAKKVTIRETNDGALFLIETADASGKVNTTPVDSRHVPAHDQMVKSLIGAAKTGQSLRDARQALLGEIFKNKKLGDYRGKSDAKTGKLDPKFKAAVRECELEYFRTLEAKGELKSIVKATGENADADFQAFVTEITTDSNYKNIKSWVSQYYGFCGLDCVTKSGYLVPQPVMQVRINAMKDVTPPDNSINAQLSRILAELKSDKFVFSAEDAAKSLPVSKALLEWVQMSVDYYAELATNANAGLPANAADSVDVTTEATTAISKGAAKVKAKETA